MAANARATFLDVDLTLGVAIAMGLRQTQPNGS
jgi:hypothetical protein